MNKLNFLLCSTALTASMFGMAGAASAGTITDAATPLIYGPAETSFSQTLNFAGFTASGGTGILTGVTVTLIDNVSGTLLATNPSGGALTLSSGYIENQLTIVTQPANLALPKIIDQSNTTGPLSVAAGSTYQNTALTGQKSGTSLATGSLSDFLGSWSISVTDKGFGQGFFETPGSVAGITEGAVTVDATYTFTTTSAPEPASVALLGAGLAGLGVIRRRRSKT